MDWVISRDSDCYIEAPNDYQGEPSAEGNCIVYPVYKYHESDGIRVYTPIKTWSRERTNEYKLRRWEDINKASEKI